MATTILPRPLIDSSNISMDPSYVSIEEVQQHIESLMNDIQELQKNERDMFNDLETMPDLDAKQKADLITKINNLSEVRVSLYVTLQNVSKSYEDTSLMATGALRQQLDAIDIVEKEMNIAKQRIQAIQDENSKELRMIEINTYFGNQYAEHGRLLYILIWVLLTVVIITFLYSRDWITNRIYLLAIVVVAYIGGVRFWKVYASAVMRDNMNYNQYNWSFDMAKAPQPQTNEALMHDPWQSQINMGNLSALGICVGSQCCSAPTKYDSKLGKCV